MKYRRIFTKYVAPICLVLIVWKIAEMVTPALFFPRLADFIVESYAIVIRGDIFHHVFSTISRVFMGWSIGTVLGIIIGLGIGESLIVSDVISPPVSFLRCIPPVAWVGLFVIWFGVGGFSLLMLVIYISSLLCSISVIDGMVRASSDVSRIRAAKSMGASRWQVFYKVKIPIAMPQIWTGIKTALSISFMAIIAAEMLVASSGLGYLVWMARTYFKMELLFLAIIFLGTVGYSVKVIMGYLGRSVLRRYDVA